MLFRDAVERDLEAMTRLQNAFLDTTSFEWRETPHTVSERREWWQRQHAAGHPILVADDDGTVVGWCSYDDFRDSRKWPGYRFTVEHTIHVAESHWGRGVSHELLASLEQRARDGGKRVMVAAIDASNRRSIEFHRRHGYVEVAHMPGVGEKWGQRLDLLLLQRELRTVD